MENPAPKMPQALVLSLGFFMATLIYVVIAFVLAQSNGWTYEWRVLPDLQILIYIFAGLALILSGAVLVLPGLGKIPRIAMAEAVAILGLVLVFLHQSPLWVLPFAGLSLILQVFLSPLFDKGGS